MTHHRTEIPLFPLPSCHALQWESASAAISEGLAPHSQLLIGPLHVNVISFAHRYLASLLCHQSGDVHCPCSSCHLLRANTHPDLHVVAPEKGAMIKIDQIRSLQQIVYQKPLCGEIRVILIECADKLNVNAANALLKILEEPPFHAYFILVAEQQRTIPATIISRCSRVVFPDRLFDPSAPIRLGEHYPKDSSQAKLYSNRIGIIRGLCDVRQGKLSPCEVAANWNTSYALDDILWMLYLIFAEAIQVRLLSLSVDSEERQALLFFIKNTPILVLFRYIEKIVAMMLQNSRANSFNALLILEDFLIDLVK